MAEVTSQDFQKLLAEQQRTNELMVQANKDPSLPSSIKQNLGEILNASRLAKSSETFQKTEGITKTDDAVRLNVSEQIETNKNLLGLGDLLIFQNNLIEKLVAIQDRVLSITDVKTLRITGPSASQETEMQKDADARFKSSKELDEDNLEENKKTNKLLGFLQGLKSPAGLKSVVGKLFGLLGLIALFKFLTGPDALKLAEALDKTVLPALKDLGTFLLSVGGKVATFIGNMAGVLIDPDSTTMEKVGASLALLITGGLVFFSKSILGFLGGLAIKGLLGLAGLNLGAILAPIGGILLFVLGAIGGAVKGLIEGQKAFDEAREEGDNVLLALTKGVGAFIAGFVGFIPDLLVKGIGKFVGIFDEELGKKIEAFSFTGIIKDVLGVIGDTVRDLFMGLFSGIRKLLFGKTREDLESELEKDRAMEERLKKELEGTKKTGKALERLKGKLTGAQNRIKKAEGQLKKLEAEGATTTGGLFGTMSQVDTVSGKGGKPKSSGRQKYKGGSAMAGQSILVGELGPELMIPRTDAQIFSAKRSEEMIMAALSRGLSGGGEGGGDVITQIDGRVNNSSSILTVNNNRVTNPNSTLNAIAMST